MATPTEVERWQRSEPVIVEVRSPADGLGRQHLMTTWLDTNVGPHCNERGRRGQMFHVVLADHIARWEAAGFKVDVTTNEETQR